ncbi:MAG: hypothetical protein ACLUNZ_08190 [Evtepia sp.]
MSKILEDMLTTVLSASRHKSGCASHAGNLKNFFVGGNFMRCPGFLWTRSEEAERNQNGLTQTRKQRLRTHFPVLSAFSFSAR